MLRRALQLEVGGLRKNGRSKRTWMMQVKEESMKVGLSKEDALCQSMRIVGVNQIATMMT